MVVHDVKDELSPAVVACDVPDLVFPGLIVHEVQDCFGDVHCTDVRNEGENSPLDYIELAEAKWLL